MTKSLAQIPAFLWARRFRLPIRAILAQGSIPRHGYLFTLIQPWMPAK